MNYKKIIKSRKLRLQILKLLSWIPDGIMIPLQYKIHTGRKLNLKNPKRFTEKLQLYKMYYRNPLMLQCTDKYNVRNYVKELGYSDILIPLIGVYNDPIEIDFDLLPNTFVANTTDGGGGNQVLICQDKSILGRDEFFIRLSEWMASSKVKPAGREWAYENGYPRRIIIEELIRDNDRPDLIDYKFFCFDGKVKMVYGVSDRTLGKSAKIGIYTPEFVKMNVSRNDEEIQKKELRRPPNYNEMILIAEALSHKFPHVRVDLYNIGGKIYFSELTFYDGSGYMKFTPDSYDIELGEYFNISSFTCK